MAGFIRRYVSVHGLQVLRLGRKVNAIAAAAWVGFAAALLSASPHASTQDLKVDSTEVIQQKLDEASQRGGTLHLTAGIYVIHRSLVMHPGTRLLCDQGVVFIARGDWPDLRSSSILRNRNWGSSVITDHDLSVEGCGFDYTEYSKFRGNGDAHAISFRMVENVRIKGITCIRVGDCTAMMATRDTTVEDSHAKGITNACWDHWESPVRVVVRNNTCAVWVSGGGTWFGVLVTGTPGRGEYGMAVDAVIQNNRFEGPFGAAIWINGMGALGSGARNVNVLDNAIDMNGHPGQAIKISGGGSDILVSRNHISGSGRAISVTAGGDSGGSPLRVRVTDNVIERPIVTDRGKAVIANDAAGTEITGNMITGGDYPVGILLDGIGDIASSNAIDRGRLGRYSLSRKPHTLDGNAAGSGTK